MFCEKLLVRYVYLIFLEAIVNLSGPAEVLESWRQIWDWIYRLLLCFHPCVNGCYCNSYITHYVLKNINKLTYCGAFTSEHLPASANRKAKSVTDNCLICISSRKRIIFYGFMKLTVLYTLHFCQHMGFWYMSHKRSDKRGQMGIFSEPFLLAYTQILAHRIRISEILPWDRKSYLTHAILPRTSSNVIKWNCILAYSGTSGSLF